MAKGRYQRYNFFHYFQFIIPRKWIYYCIVSICLALIILICSLFFGHKYSNKQIIINPNVNNKIEILPFIQEKTNFVNEFTNNEKNGKNYNKTNVLPGNEELYERLRYLINCVDRDYASEMVLNGNFWVLKNYIPAGHGELACHESITYTTHGDYTFLKHLIPLLKRWRAPISIALHAPGTDFIPTIQSILYLRDCLLESIAVRQFVTFHIYFNSKHIPDNIQKFERLSKFNCSLEPPYKNIKRSELYTSAKNLLYPINVGRNIARNAALTHFILSSDIEFYPSRNLAQQFLEMIVLNETKLQSNNSRVFTLPLFKTNDTNVLEKIKTKKILLNLSSKRVVSPYNYPLEPKLDDWMDSKKYNNFGVFDIVKRTGEFKNWDPIYIGTHAEPYYDERLRLEGNNDRTTQNYALCLLNYEFAILNNAFLISAYNSSEIKSSDINQQRLEGITNELILKISAEMRDIYGERVECDT